MAWSARLLAAAYAVLYGALDAISGIGAGHQVVLAARRRGARPPVEDLYAIGDRTPARRTPRAGGVDSDRAPRAQS